MTDAVKEKLEDKVEAQKEDAEAVVIEQEEAKNVVDHSKESKEDIDIFLPDPRKFKTMTGESFETIKIGWGAESKIVFRYGKLIIKFMKATAGVNVEDAVDEIDLASLTSTALQSLNYDDFIASIIDEAPEVITDTVCALTGQDKDWVDNNLDLETVVDIVVPFIKRRWSNWSKMLQRFLPQLQAEV